MQKNKILLVINGGIGDAILWIPAILELQKTGYTVDCWTTQNSIHHILSEVFKVNGTVFLEKNHHFLKLTKLSWEYKKVYVDLWPSIVTVLNLIFISKIKLNLLLNKNRSIYLRILLFIKKINMYNISNNKNHMIIILFEFLGIYKDFNLNTNKSFESKNYIVLQFFCGDDIECHKNIPLSFWKDVITWLKTFRSDYELIALGTEGSNILECYFGLDCFSNLVSKTSLVQAVEIIKYSKAYIGLDSGLMHAAALLNKPTLTFWGPSSEVLYGYKTFNARKHQIIRCEFECSPCSSPANSNSSRYTSPLDCIDKRCIKGFSSLEVVSALNKFCLDNDI